MIRSKADYDFYLRADKLASGKKYRRPKLIGDDIWKFQRLLRQAEYYTNCKKSLLSKLYLKYILYRYHKMSIRLGFTIPLNVFGPGLCIAHRGTIVVNKNAKVGKNCRIHACTNIGSNIDGVSAPQIGNNVYIGPGAKIFGDITIADNIAIGANSVVNKSFYEKGISIAGVPARKINNKGTGGTTVSNNELFHSNTSEIAAKMERSPVPITK
ncbi:MAG: serine acetyltransferase [Methanosarcina flavescens]|uniref:Serine acetyltransferase n=2 Tax=Methanosarcina flavescens TaxID=1715806 RepID=A0A660HRH4_9EURY|nr:serine acetyltransferase [Methanosarcina flavescens]NLK31644.1 serine acetyltransferase [Methanosarcina flavescens]